MQELQLKMQDLPNRNLRTSWYDLLGRLAFDVVADFANRNPVGPARQARGLGCRRARSFHNCPKSGSVYEPVGQRLLPLDEEWRHKLAAAPWPTASLPEVIGGGTATLRAFISGYLFASIFRACAESLASENASRLAAMQRADKNIDELLEDLNRTFYRLRQNGIDEELFDVVSGFEALTPKGSR
jgi:F-type H+-transporting ATPase subunit gamma